jgi:hypothetical protein
LSDLTEHPFRRRPAALVLLSAALLAGCSKSDVTASAPVADVKAVVSVKELMENIIDPQADFVFEAVAVDVTEKGTTEIRPTTDDDWLKVQRGAITLLEASNLLKMPRRIAPLDDRTPPGGPGAPELSPDEIQAKVDKDRTSWNTHADRLRDEAAKVLEIVKARNADRLFAAGTDLDRACENCHLDYWYPGDRAAVERDRNSRATFGNRGSK